MTLMGHGKFRGKLTSGFQFSLGKVLPISLNQPRRVKISDLMGLLFLKGTLVQPQTVAGVSSCDTEGPGKVWGQTDSWFPIQAPQKICEFHSSEPRGSKFQEFPLVNTEGHGKFRGKLTPGFLSRAKKNIYEFRSS